MQAVPRYGRWQREFPARLQVDAIRFTAPDGTMVVRPVFDHQPAQLVYDEHGFEQTRTVGPSVQAVRYTPTLPGQHRYEAMQASRVVATGALQCQPSDHPGYVIISPRDPRYFCHTDGSPFAAMGLNLCSPPRYPLPRGQAHFETSTEDATLGCLDYRRWFSLLQQHGANFVRIWLSNPYFEVETDIAGELDLSRFARTDRLVALAREYGVRLKLCLEHFRTFKPGTPFSRTLRHPEDGRRPEGMDAWFGEQTWRELWLNKVRAYIARYGDDPTVMAWELWNEIDCCATSDWSVQRDWTRDMLRTIQAMAPNQMVVNSLGSFDDERKQAVYDDFTMDELAFQQVHRYLDQGAPLEICRTDPVALGIDAVQRARRPDRPVILAETGAVNDRHTGPFRFYRWDNRGLIMHDTTYPAFFAGAAGSGQIWHWDRYVDEKDLWQQFEPLTQLIQGIPLDQQAFQPIDLSTEKAWCLGLVGSQHVLLWLRNKADRWDLVLRDRREAQVLRHLKFDLSPWVSQDEVALTVIWPWDDAQPRSNARWTQGTLEAPAFGSAVLIRLDLAIE